MRNNIKIKSSVCIKIQDQVCYSLLLDRISVHSNAPPPTQKEKTIQKYTQHNCSANGMASEFVVLAKKRKKKIRSVSSITYITVSHQNSLQQKYSNNDTIANHSHLQLYMGGTTICTLKSTALQTNMTSFIGLNPLPSHTLMRKDISALFACMCTACLTLSAAGQRAQRGVTV